MYKKDASCFISCIFFCDYKCLYVVNKNQTGSHLGADRPVNPIARLLWDDGFKSPNGQAMLIYDLGDGTSVSIYCTEVLGIKKGQ